MTEGVKGETNPSVSAIDDNVAFLIASVIAQGVILRYCRDGEGEDALLQRDLLRITVCQPPSKLRWVTGEWPRGATTIEAHLRV